MLIASALAWLSSRESTLPSPLRGAECSFNMVSYAACNAMKDSSLLVTAFQVPFPTMILYLPRRHS